MAVIDFVKGKKKQTYPGMKRVIQYIFREDKTLPHLIQTVNCNPQSAYDEFILTKQQFHKEDGRLYIHFTQNFDPRDELTPETALEIGKKLISLPQFEGFQICVASHIDTKHRHNHFVINSVNMETGRKWQQSPQQLQALKDYSDDLCRKYGLRIVEESEKHSGHRNRGEFRSERNGTCWKTETFLAAKHCMRVAISKDDFIKKMGQIGYSVKWTERKYITFTNVESGMSCRNNHLYPKEMFTKENLLKTFKQNKIARSEQERREEWNALLSVLALFRSNNRDRKGKLPLSSLEGQALIDEMIKRENKGEIDWESNVSNEDENEYEF